MIFEPTKPRKRKDLTGQRFNKLTFIKFMGVRKQKTYWLCRCDCGIEKIIRTVDVTTGDTKTCGCSYLTSMPGKITQLNITHDMSKTRFYNIWRKLRTRCNYTKDVAYEFYGGRGIQVCESWESAFENFKADMYKSYLDHVQVHGEQNTSIDRIDFNGNYEPTNCQWATCKIQSLNRRNSK